MLPDYYTIDLGDGYRKHHDHGAIYYTHYARPGQLLPERLSRYSVYSVETTSEPKWTKYRHGYKTLKQSELIPIKIEEDL